jgi:type II secretory pathway pseudopilin PulG
MKKNNSSNALLIELLIVVLFFMISATVLLQLFSSARSQSAKAESLSLATVEAQNIAEQLYASDDGEALLLSEGFRQTENGWEKEENGLLTIVSLDHESTESGILHTGTIVLSLNGETLLTLPCTRYEEVHA